MDALIPVFVAVLLAETGGRVQGVSHALGQRFSAYRGSIIIALALTSAASLAVAAIGGAIVAQMIDFRARTLLAALALLFAAVPLFLKPKPLKNLPPGGVWLSALRSYVPVQFGDASQFLVFALAARSGQPILAGAAGLTAIVLSGAIPILLGQQWPAALRVVRVFAGILLLIGGIIFAAAAFRVA